MSEEERTLNTASENAGEDIAAAEKLAREMTESLAETEQLLERLTAELAEWNARKASLERGRDLATALLDSSTNQLVRCASPRWTPRWNAPRMRPTCMPPKRRPNALAKSRKRHAPPPAQARTKFHDAEGGEAVARDPLEAAEREVQRLSAEVKALGDLLHPEGEGLFPPLVDAVTVQSGYEAALAAALGDDLQAPLDDPRRTIGAIWANSITPCPCPKVPSRSAILSRRPARWIAAWR